MRRLIESTIVSLDGIAESPDRWARFDQEAVQYSMNELVARVRGWYARCAL